MASKSKDEIFQAAMRPLLQPGETLQCVAYGVKQPHILLIILFISLAILPGMILVQVLTKHFLVALTDRRIIVARVKGNWKVEGHFDYPLGKVGAPVKTSTGMIFTHIQIKHPQLPFAAKFHRAGSANNRPSAMAIAEALNRG